MSMTKPSTHTLQPPFVIAHRGKTSSAMENSERAVLDALEHKGIDGVNIDLRACADDIYLAHDHFNQMENIKLNTKDHSTVQYINCDLKSRKDLQAMQFVSSKQSASVCFWSDVKRWITAHPNKLFWLDLKDADYRPRTVDVCCNTLFSCLSCCSPPQSTTHPLVSRLVSNMIALDVSERARCIVSSTNPYLMIDWIALATSKGIKSDVYAFGFDYGNQSKWQYDLAMSNLALENMYCTTFVSMGDNLMSSDKQAAYHGKQIHTAIYNDFSIQTLPSVRSHSVYVVEL